MRVLVIGANGFIGSSIVAALTRSGIKVRGLARDPAKLATRFPGIETVKADLTQRSAQDPGYWIAPLHDVDAVVNAAGILQSRRTRDAWAVHYHAPKALFECCERNSVKRIVQISAIGIEKSETVFARSKLAADGDLMARDLDWTVLRPVIVVGNGSYGGTSLLRAIAAFPWVTPVIGEGDNVLDFIHKDDLAISVARILTSDAARRTVLEPASGRRFTFVEAVRAYRGWLGLEARPILRVPKWCARGLARLGDLTRLDPVTTTALRQFEGRLTGNAAAFEAATRIKARGLRELLSERPAETQDLWHARLYLLRPVIRLALAVLWTVNGLADLIAEPDHYRRMLEPLAVGSSLASLLQMLAGVTSLAIASSLVFAWRLKDIAIVQLALVLGSTVALTIAQPGLWADPFGGVAKNIAVIALILTHRILEEER